MLPVKKFNDSPATQELEAAFRRSVVVYDVEGWGRERMMAELRAQLNFRWRVSELPGGTMLVEGPAWWKEKVLREEIAVIGDQQLRVEPWDPTMDAGSRLKSVWIRILGFPMKLWSRFEFERLIEEFGVLLEIDVATQERLSFVAAKLRIGVCKFEKIPSERDIEFRNERGEWVWRTVQFIVDTPIHREKVIYKKRKLWIRKPDQDSNTDGAGPSAPAKDKQVLEGDGEDDLMSEEYEEEIEMETDQNTQKEEGEQPGSQTVVVIDDQCNPDWNEKSVAPQNQNAERLIGMSKGEIEGQQQQLVIYQGKGSQEDAEKRVDSQIQVEGV